MTTGNRRRLTLSFAMLAISVASNGPICFSQSLPPLPETILTDPLLGEGVYVRQIRIEGSTVFSTELLSEITNRYTGRRLRSDDLATLRQELTELYVTRGYVNSFAVMPEKPAGDGVIIVEIMEGHLADVEIDGERHFRETYIRNRLNWGPQLPLNAANLLRQLQLLDQDPRIGHFEAALLPGLEPGEARLKVRIYEENPFAASVGFNNYQSPTIGSERLLVSAAHQNLSGYGDILSVTWARSDGVQPQVAASYMIPVTSQDSTLTLKYARNDFTVVEAPFHALGVQSQSSSWGLTFRHPLYRSVNSELGFGISAERIHNRTFLLEEPFSFSLGSEDGKSTVTALRVFQDWAHRSRNQAVAIQSQFSFGLDVLGATIHDADSVYRSIGITEPPDGRFFAWFGQFQWARRWGRAQVIFRTDAQLSGDPLLSTEQIPIGGRNSIRGYRENQLVRDNAVISSIETRFVLIAEKSWARSLEIAPFIDMGEGWHTMPEQAGRDRILLPAQPSQLLSTGLGVRWNAVIGNVVRWNPQFEVYWGKRLKDFEEAGNPTRTLQDRGIHFSVGLGVS